MRTTSLPAGGRKRYALVRRPAMLIRAALLACIVLLAGVPGTPAPAWAQHPPTQGDEALWMPGLAPRGPLVIVISIPAQRAYVYRNGVRIGTSPVSTGKPGNDTPSGVYRILQKRREHYSNLYDSAPMPYMQRLTWDGVALHAGRVPGYPASHGCVRLPRTFAEQLFAVTTLGTVVVVAANGTFPATVVSPGLFAPVDAGTGAPIDLAGQPEAAWEWRPELAPEGPLTVLISTSDRRMIVSRNGVAIGRAELVVQDVAVGGTRAYVLLEGSLPQPSLAVPDRPARRWMALSLPGSQTDVADLRDAMASGRLTLPVDFARQVYDVLKAGDMVIVSDEPLQAPGDGAALLRSEAGGDL